MCDTFDMMNSKRKTKIVGFGYIVFGLLWAANALVAGPHAFGAKWLAVAALCLSGFFMVVVGVYIIKSGANNSKSKPS